MRYEISHYLCFSGNFIHDEVKSKLVRRECPAGFFSLRPHLLCSMFWHRVVSSDVVLISFRLQKYFSGKLKEIHKELLVTCHFKPFELQNKVIQHRVHVDTVHFYSHHQSHHASQQRDSEQLIVSFLSQLPEHFINYLIYLSRYR